METKTTNNNETVKAKMTYENFSKAINLLEDKYGIDEEKAMEMVMDIGLLWNMEPVIDKVLIDNVIAMLLDLNS